MIKNMQYLCPKQKLSIMKKVVLILCMLFSMPLMAQEIQNKLFGFTLGGDYSIATIQKNMEAKFDTESEVEKSSPSSYIYFTDIAFAGTTWDYAEFQVLTDYDKLYQIGMIRDFDNLEDALALYKIYYDRLTVKYGASTSETMPELTEEQRKAVEEAATSLFGISSFPEKNDSEDKWISWIGDNKIGVELDVFPSESEFGEKVYSVTLSYFDVEMRMVSAMIIRDEL